MLLIFRIEVMVMDNLAVDPNLTPPDGLFQPTEAIGKIWRENPELQNRVGWAIEPPVPFTPTP
jgi:hypothetical protein